MRLLLIDKITEITENSIRAEKYLTVNEDIYEYHFPNNPVMPAAFMTEAALQLSRIFVWKRTDFKYSLIPIEFNKFKFKNIVKPGGVLSLDLKFEGNEQDIEKENLVKIVIQGICLKEIVFDGILICKYVDFSSIHHFENSKNYLNYLLRDFKHE